MMIEWIMLLAVLCGLIMGLLVGGGTAFRKEQRANHVFELLQAEEDGRLFISPCKIGDEVWCATRGDDGVVYIDRERVVDVSSKGFYISEFLDGSGCGILVPYEEIGKSFFLTRELAEMGGADE